MCKGGVTGGGFLVSEKSEALKVKDISALIVFATIKLVWTMNKCSFGMALPDNAVTKKEPNSVYVYDFYPV